MSDKPKRRWFQSSWLAAKMRRARRQREAVEAIRAAQGLVRYDCEVDSARQSIESSKPSAPAWLRRVLGEDFLSNVVIVRLPSTSSNENMEHLRGLPNLQGLWLSQTRVTDAGLEHLEGLTNLQELYLGATQVTDTGLEHLKGLVNLQYLDLSGAQVTDPGLEHLRGLVKLQDLHLRNSQVTDAGVKMLQEALPDCEIHR